MKTTTTIKGYALGVMLFLATTVASAGNGGKTAGDVSVVPYLNTDYSLLSFVNIETKAKLSIVNEEGITLYTQWVNKASSAQKVLDFSKLEDGKYKAVLKSKGADAVTHSFEIKNKKIAKVSEA